MAWFKDGNGLMMLLRRKNGKYSKKQGKNRPKSYFFALK
jgi:hypothetical protein